MRRTMVRSFALAAFVAASVAISPAGQAMAANAEPPPAPDSSVGVNGVAAAGATAAGIPCEAWAYFPRRSGTKVLATAAGFCDVYAQSLDLTAYLMRNNTVLWSTRVSKHANLSDWVAVDTIPVSDPAGSQKYCNVVTFNVGDARGNTAQFIDQACTNL